MVRYSKLEFRTLVRKYGVDLCFTPMIMADSFCRSEKARQNEFSTNYADSPVIAQFAAQTTFEYLSCAEMVFPYVDGIDLNCGCPQRWAVSTGYGCALLKDPELLRDLTSTVRRNFPSDFSVSAKIRVQKPLDVTINLVRQLEKCGLTFITVHGRTPSQKIGEPSNVEYLAEIKKSISIPMVANGDVRTLDGANELFGQINCDGLMAARGILSNPALFSGASITPVSCLQDWVNIVHANPNVTFQCFHHHLSFMMEKILKRKQRVEFNQFFNKDQVHEFLQQQFGIIPTQLNVDGSIVCEYDENKFRVRSVDHVNETECSAYQSNNNPGKFFQSKLSKDKNNSIDGLDFMDSNIFD
ncbi:tRNA-dihydrouridine(20a/20b) synthase [NAD(P)+]-like, partial [Pseudolycoriella hygida]